MRKSLIQRFKDLLPWGATKTSDVCEPSGSSKAEDRERRVPTSIRESMASVQNSAISAISNPEMKANPLIADNDFIQNDDLAKLHQDLGPDPSTILGENYGAPFKWDHPDDLFIDFQYVSGVAMGDMEFFLRYTGAKLVDESNQVVDGMLTPEEREKYPQHFYPCFAEIKDVVNAHLTTPLMQLNDVQYCLLVLYESVMGLLLIREDDAIDIKRRGVGFETETDKLHYQMQFLRFDATALKRMDPAWGAAAIYNSRRGRQEPLRVNFANYIESE